MRSWPDRRALGLVAAAAVAIWVAVDHLRWWPTDPVHTAKLQAARIMERGLAELRAERERRGLGWDTAADPNRTGLIGRDYTDLTTTLGSLPAKRTATNPNVAGLVVELLDRAGVQRGDAVAVTFSGSFPALNLAVLAATRAMELRPLIISSVGASSYGANEPGWTWPEMERGLSESGVITHRSSWVALGGLVDERGGLDGTGLDRGDEAIRRSGVARLNEGGRVTLEHDVQRRMELYRAGAGGRPRAFINVGGGLVALGGDENGGLYPAGLIQRRDASVDPRRGLIARMLADGVPVVHLLDMRHLAAAFGLPFDPVPLPPVPDGAVMRPRRYGRILAGGGLIALLAVMVGVTRRRGSSG